ncbi:putative oxidoreductase [Smittium culicis]|uniref:Putative oxidoreductase n=1 Tax=Smittium culicis TaxID=133412 RepID=A0A1R1YAC7_9FUNG|nr:putative oxidoreductase [Smittium culicis]
MFERIQWKTVFITGASAGIGEATAVLFAKYGNLPEWAAQIDILVNNAGLALGALPLMSIPESSIDTMINTNVKGLIFVTQQALPKMIQRNSGHIINVGSALGYNAIPTGSVYSATKFAVRALTDSLRIETNATKIKVSEVCPGIVKTDFNRVKFFDNKDAEDNFYKGLETATAEDLAEVIVFTASTHPRCVISNITAVPIRQANPYIIHREC